MTKHHFSIRPIKPCEHERWFTLLAAHHYLGRPTRVTGERIFYVAEDELGRWVALLGWCAPAMHLYDRDHWIGWSVSVRKIRLRYIANNFRFLILPGNSNYQNLASQLLSENLKRLSRDWQNSYAHPIYLVETFVDMERFYGGCYRASNWICVGKTKGFTRKNSRSYYEENGVLKWIFLRPLHRSAQRILSNPTVAVKNHHGHTEDVLVIDVNKLPIAGKGGLIDALKQVDDPRRRQGRRHSHISGLCIAACAMLSGARGFKGIHQWAGNLTDRQRLKMRCRNGNIPSSETIRRMLINLDADQFDRIIGDWLINLAAKGKIAGLAVDGKTLRGSKDGKKKGIHLLSALVHEEKLTVAQSKVDDKENEITGFIPLIKNLNLGGTVVTADAMHCQVDHATYLVNKKNCDYAFVVKGNQPTLHDETSKILDEYSENCETHQRTTCGHGRIDQRTISMLELNAHDKHKITFPYATHVFKITRHSTNKSTGEESSFEKFGITSISPQKIDAESMLEIMLGHWQIESGHWIRDEVFFEDKSRIRTGAGPQVMASLRNVSIGIMRYAGAKNLSETVQNIGWARPKTSMRAIGLRYCNYKYNWLERV